MQLLVSTIKSEMKTLMKNDVKLSSIGDIENLPGKCYKELLSAKEQTAQNKGLNLILALNYSGKWDITQACKRALVACQNNELSENELTDSNFERFLSTADIPDPELLIRTSGEFRISNFMLWQLAYTEIYITEVLWPDFRKEHLINALRNYQTRERRFGKVISE